MYIGRILIIFSLDVLSRKKNIACFFRQLPCRMCLRLRCSLVFISTKTKFIDLIELPSFIITVSSLTLLLLLFLLLLLLLLALLTASALFVLAS